MSETNNINPGHISNGIQIRPTWAVQNLTSWVRQLNLRRSHAVYGVLLLFSLTIAAIPKVQQWFSSFYHRCFSFGLFGMPQML